MGARPLQNGNQECTVGVTTASPNMSLSRSLFVTLTLSLYLSCSLDRSLFPAFCSGSNTARKGWPRTEGLPHKLYRVSRIRRTPSARPSASHPRPRHESCRSREKKQKAFWQARLLDTRWSRAPAKVRCAENIESPRWQRRCRYDSLVTGHNLRDTYCAG